MVMFPLTNSLQNNPHASENIAPTLATMRFYLLKRIHYPF